MTFSQRPSKGFTVTAAAAGNFGFTKTAIETFTNAAATSVGNSYILSVDPATVIPDSSVALVLGQTLKDMGKTVRFGSPTEPCLYEFRLVQAPGTYATDGKTGDAAKTFYVLVSNMTTSTVTTVGGSNTGNLLIKVARA